jgi:hypothetical protein
MTEGVSRRYPEDALGRRIRGHRTPSGKRIVIGERDIEIFKLLQRYRYLRSTALWALLPTAVRGKSVKRFQDRLTDLFHETGTEHGGAYLDWPQQQRQAFNARYAPSIYALAPAGERLLQELGIAEQNVTDLVRNGRMGAIRAFPHAMMICDTLAAIELGARADPQVRFITWPEIIARAPQATRKSSNPFAIPVTVRHSFVNTGQTPSARFHLIPDGLFGLEYTQRSGKRAYRFFALEAEHRNRVDSRGLKQTSFLKKVLGYRHILEHELQKAHFGVTSLYLLTVTPTASRIATMQETVHAVYGTAGFPRFLFSPIPVLGFPYRVPPPMPELYTAGWSRAGHGVFFLSNPDMQ